MDYVLSALITKANHEREFYIHVWETYWSWQIDLQAYLADRSFCPAYHGAYEKVDRYVLRYKKFLH